MDKDRALVRLLETENPASAIIFCNTKSNVHYVTGVLQGFGYSADELSADLSQSRREAVLEKIRQGKLQYLVATDVAARGIDIPQLSHVFLYEPPEDHESYIHRAGRTGRAGAAGTVISLVDVMRLAADIGLSVSFGSDAHNTEETGSHFGELAAYAAVYGFSRSRIFVGRERMTCQLATATPLMLTMVSPG
jgi:Superfamily II DNA and RNA helicases